MADIKLTPKQDLFCTEYLIDLNATQAAIRAGYSKSSANNIGATNLAKPSISAKIQQLIKERSKRVEIDADWVLMSAKQVFDRCMQHEAVIDRDGSATGEYKFEHSGANKSLEIIGKHVKVRAFEKETESASETMTDSINKLIDRLPN